MKFRNLVLLVLLNFVRSDESIRSKRFLDSLWMSEVKEDVKNGLTYSQLPPEHLSLFSGINDHSIQRRDGQSVLTNHPLPNSNPPPRFIHPTRMAQMKPFHHNVAITTTTASTVQSKGPKIVMKPNLAPSFSLKTKDQPLPEIHKNNRFVMPKPASQLGQQKSPFATNQQLPIKKSYENERRSIKNSPIEQFYETKEFHALLAEHKLKVDTKKLPPIADVMNVMGTTTAEDTLDTIRDVMGSPEGLQMIRDFIDTNEEETHGDKFYNYDEDNGVGEIKMPPVRHHPNLIPVYRQQLPVVQYRQPPTVIPSTSATEAPRSWWRPSTWFNSPPKNDQQETDAALLVKIVKIPQQNLPENISYVKNFIAPSNQEIIIDPPFKTGAEQVLSPSNPIYQNEGQLLGARIMPTVRMTEDQFRQMIKNLNLSPIQSPVQGFPRQVVPSIPVKLTTQGPTTVLATTQASTTSTTVTTEAITTTTTESNKLPTKKKVSFLPLPSFASPIENRRTFDYMASSGPQRISPFDFTSGRLHKASLEDILREEKKLISKISGLTEESLKNTNKN